MIAATRRNFGPLLVFLGAMLWATDAPFRVALLSHLPPSFIVLAEHAVNVLLLLPLVMLKWSSFRGLTRREWLTLGAIAIGGSAIATFAFTQAFAFVNPSVAILLQKLQPFIAISLAGMVLGERMRKTFWIWAILAVAGAYVISFPDLVPRVYEGEEFNPNLIGVSLALLAAVLWGASTVLGKYALKRVDFTAVTCVRFIIAFVFLLLWNMWSGDAAVVTTLTARDVLFLVIIAIVSGSFSLLLYYRGLKTTSASVATIAELGFPLAAVLVNAVFLHESLRAAQIIGMAILLLSVLQLKTVNERDTRAGA